METRGADGRKYRAKFANANFVLSTCHFSEVEQSLASAIADRATDEVVEALTRYRRGLGINDSPLVSYEDTNNTPDVLRSRSNQVNMKNLVENLTLIVMRLLQNFKDSMGLMSLDTRGLDLPQLPGLDSPTVNYY